MNDYAGARPKSNARSWDLANGHTSQLSNVQAIHFCTEEGMDAVDQDLQATAL